MRVDYNDNIFNRSKFKIFQSSDNISLIIEQYLIDKSVFKKDLKYKSPLNDLRINNSKIYNKLLLNQFRFGENQLIEITIFDKLSNTNIWVIFVPYLLRNKIIRFAHKNPYSIHYGAQQTYNNITGKYWWPNMYTDCIYHAKTRCLSIC